VIGIIGDCHLGASLKAGTKDPVTGVPSRLVDYHNTLLFAIEDIAKTCDTIVFTGDIFEHRYPHMIQQQMFSNALRRAVELGVKQIHILIGNHDQQRTASTTTLAYLSELKLPNIVIHDEPSTIRMGDDALHFFPYRDRKYLAAPTYAEGIVAADKIIAKLAADRAPGSNILIGHMAIEGTFFAEEEAELYTDNELMLPKASFAPFDLTIMGHVHTPGIVSTSPQIYYVGSLEKRGAFENHKKQYCVVDLANRSADWKVLPCKDFYEFDLGAPKSGVDLMGLLLKQLDKQIGTTDLKGNIVKAGISVSSEDIGHLNPEAIMAALTARGCSFVYPPAISVKTERALRSDVKELGSDTETWSQYIQGLVTDKEFAAQLIAVGNSIIAEEEA
jgi:DNA repair exonuclease SbcCD nuclease subunit